MLATIFEAVTVRLSKAALKRIQQATQQRLCVACLQPLEDSVVKRGCHEKCYKATLRAIESGKTTMSERVRAGKLLEKKAPGRYPTNPVAQEFA